MSHFTVLVIGENPEAQLAPYQENNMGDCPKEYLKYKVWDKNGDSHWFNSEEEFRQSGIEVEEGEEGYWENPNKKWDYWVLGGRWTGFFKTKLGVTAAVVGTPGLLTAEAENGYADQLPKGEIDFEYMRKEAELKAGQKYDFALSIIGDLPPNKTWNQVRDEFQTVEEARSFYWAQDRCKVWNVKRSDDFKNWPLSFDSTPDDFLVSREEYVKAARDRAISTHAVIKDGKWYEKGEMGWFAVVHNGKDAGQWNKEFNDLLDSLPDETLLSVYDCHI